MFEDNPVGYFTISTSNIQKNHINKCVRPFTRATSIFPAIIIQYIGIDKNNIGIGIGPKVLKWIIGFGRRNPATKVGCRYIIPYAERAMPFYIKNDFRISEIKNGTGGLSFYLMYRDLFPECVQLDKDQ